jgi:hypothetical protein
MHDFARKIGNLPFETMYALMVAATVDRMDTGDTCLMDGTLYDLVDYRLEHMYAWPDNINRIHKEVN